jgi:V-type H+-transporting ATPase subunit a
VDTYGIPGYKEINPAVFAIATFPFLFGMMFGDIGHGAIYLMIGIVMILKYNPKASGTMKEVFKMRYLICALGFFATYCGVIYNDFMSIPINGIGGISCYNNEKTGFNREAGCVYLVGVDPVWYTSTKTLTFMNSLKMKTAVIYGVLQMTFGLILKALNCIHRNDKLSLFAEVIP